MSDPIDEQRWLDVLAGKAEPRDAEERLAARARSYFQKEEQHHEPLDAATRQRVENLLNAKLAALAAKEAQSNAEATKKPGVLAGLLGWLIPAGGGHTGRYAALAAVALAAVVLPFVVPTTPPGAEDPSTIKSPVQRPVPETVWASDHPADEAAALLQTLAQQGIVAQLTEEGADRVVQAQVPADSLAPVRDALQAQGYPLAADGQIRIRFKAKNP